MSTPGTKEERDEDSTDCDRRHGDVAPVLRGRALEIVDAQGKVRAQIIVTPAGTLSNGGTYAETVLFRLINPNGLPGVKVDASEKRAGLLLSRESQAQEWSGVQILTESSGSVLRLRNEDGREQVIRP